MKMLGNVKTRQIWIDDELLDPEPSKRVVCHSPDNFNWGYAGSGPSQLALAVCLKMMTMKDALRVYRDFRDEVIARLPQSTFYVEFDFDKWLEQWKILNLQTLAVA